MLTISVMMSRMFIELPLPLAGFATANGTRLRQSFLERAGSRSSASSLAVTLAAAF
jgi:hypothetical protein